MEIFSGHIREVLVAAALLVTLLLILLRMIWSRRRTARRIRHEMLSVLPALERCLEGEHDDLTHWLRRAARRYPDEVRTFALIGDLLRRADAPLKATFLYKTLLYRKRLSPADKSVILLGLGRAHRALGDEQKALAALKQSLSAEKRAVTYRELVALERAMGLFDDALFHQRELNRIAGGDRDEGLCEIMLEAATAAHAQNREEDLQRWATMAMRHEGDTAFTLLLEVALVARSGNEERIAALARTLMDRWPDEEMTLRYLLWVFSPPPGGAQRLVPGPWSAPFAALEEPKRLLSATELAVVDKRSRFYYHLASRGSAADETRDLLAAAGGRERLFVCGACGSAIDGPVLHCAGCGLPLTVRTGTI